jgi:hypothetical protein
MDLTIRKLTRELAVVGEDAFRRRYAVPAMIYDGSMPDSDSAEREERAFVTSNVDLRGVVDDRADRKTLPPGSEEQSALESMESRVFLVRKRAGGAFADRIGIGRATNADVSVPLATVSKYHAYFTVPEDLGAGYVLTDAGSTNGTFVDGRRLEDRESAPVRTGTQILLGPHRFVFFSAAALFERVRSAALSRRASRARA